jgi:dTDP-glucose 4,6-dehydratase
VYHVRNLLITGGAGFIGSNFVRHMLAKYPQYHLVVFDILNYRGNLDNLRDVAANPRYTFVRGDIRSKSDVEAVIRQYEIDTVVNFAAETHVDRSIMDADAFITTDIYGTYVLLEATNRFGLERLHLVSTDEVYGDVHHGSSVETDPLGGRSPYAASKAGGELLALAYWNTYKTPITITRGGNNIGPYQYPENVVPLFITNALDDQPLPVYGDGLQRRPYQYVLDHCEGIDIVLHKGALGEAYNVGPDSEPTNLEMTRKLLALLGKPESLIRHVTDRPGHDRRYSLNCDKLKALGWTPTHTFDQALEKTVRWYVDNEWWWRKIKSGEFKEYYRQQYAHRLAGS